MLLLAPKEQGRHDVMNMTLNEVHQTGRGGARDRERPGPSENQANVMAFLQTDVLLVHLFFCERKAVPVQ